MELAPPEDGECRLNWVCRECEPWDVLSILMLPINPYTYHYAILAPKLVKSGRVGLALVVRTTQLVGMIENVEVVVINVVSSKDIGDEFQD